MRWLQALQKFSFQLSDSDVAILMRHFDTHKDGQISYNESARVVGTLPCRTAGELRSSQMGTSFGSEGLKQQ